VLRWIDVGSSPYFRKDGLGANNPGRMGGVGGN